MTFDPTSKDDKKQLYKVLKAVARLNYGDTIDLVIDRAIGQPIPHGPTWQRNYRRGEYDSVIAQITHRWVEKHHFTLMLVRSSFGIAKRKSQLDKVDQIIKWGQLFCLELDSETDCYAIAFQSRGDDWGVLSLGANGKDASGSIQKGINRLPQDNDGNLDPFEEDSDEGLTDFVVVTAKTDRIPMEIDRLIKWVNENECNIYRQTIRLTR